MTITYTIINLINIYKDFFKIVILEYLKPYIKMKNKSHHKNKTICKYKNKLLIRNC